MISRPWSCDTFVAQKDSTTDGRLIFGKNSDRPAGEVQPLRFVNRQERGELLQLAYLTIPDAPAYTHLGAAPFWCWGYEFGVNEYNVVIGNEAQFTRAWADNVSSAKQGNAPDGGILGMELIRLGLERASSAHEALGIMTNLLEKYGQWGSGAFGKTPIDGSYDNSYMIADNLDAWVLETSGREWVARHVTEGIYSISNEPSVRSEYDQKSESLLATAHRRGWISSDSDFDYAASHTDPMTPLQVSHMRQRRSQQLLKKASAESGVDLQSAKDTLRDHFEGTFLDGPYHNAAQPDFLTLCMHEHAAGFTWGNTAGSIITELGRDADDLTVIWWTPLPPCIGAYIPLFLQSGQVPHSLEIPLITETASPESFNQPHFDPTSYWWRFQNLLDVAKGDRAGSHFTERQASIRARFDQLEMSWITAVEELRHSWTKSDKHSRIHLASQMRSLTARPVREVDAEMDRFFSEYAPEAKNQSVDTRWAVVRQESDHT